MQEEISQRTVAILIRGAEFSANTLQKSIRAVAGQMKKKVQKGISAEHKGRQSLKSLQKDKASLSTVNLSKQNLGGFQKVARKYGIDYSLMKDKTSEEPGYILFFRGKDEAVMQAAFQEYARKKHTPQEKRSVKEDLKEIREHEAQYQKQYRSKNKQKTKKKAKVKKKEIAR